MTRLLFVLLFSISSLGVFSQNPFIVRYSFSGFFGQRDLKIENLAAGQNLNFVNYMSFLDNGYVDGILYMGFSTHLQLRNGLDVDFKVFSNDDIFPTGGKLSVQYYWNNILGISVGLFANPFFTSDYENFHNFMDAKFHSAQFYNTQKNIFDLGWKVAPVLNFESGRFFANMRFNFGLSGFVPFTNEIYQEMINSNFRRIVRYETKYNKQFFMFPEVRLGLDVVNWGNSTIGIQIQSNYLISRRSLNYTRITYNWIHENQVVEEISDPRQWFNFWNIDFGLFLKVNSSR
jgi:hypothetical protein